MHEVGTFLAKKNFMRYSLRIHARSIFVNINKQLRGFSKLVTQNVADDAYLLFPNKNLEPSNDIPTKASCSITKY